MNLASCFRGSSFSSTSSSNSNQLTVDSARDRQRRKFSSPDSGKILALTRDDIKWIQRTWYGHEDSQDLAVRIFLQVFQTKPDMAALFGLDPEEFSSKSSSSEVTGKKYLRADRRFLEHAKAFASFFDLVIQELSDGSHSDDLISIIRAMGTHHSTIPNLSFTAENFLLIKTKILETVCGQKLCAPDSGNPLDKSCMAWCKLLMFMIAEMKDAYILGVNRKHTWPGHAFAGNDIGCSFATTAAADETSSSSVSSGFCSNASSQEKLTTSMKTGSSSPNPDRRSSHSEDQLHNQHEKEPIRISGSPNSAARCPFHHGAAALPKDETRRSSDSPRVVVNSAINANNDNNSEHVIEKGLQSLKISSC